MKLRVEKIIELGEGIKAFEFRRSDRQDLPAFESGAHIRLQLTPEWSRRYSLTSDSHDLTHYTIAVLHHPEGVGSSYLHLHVREGDVIEAEGPFCAFPLIEGRHHILIAGGIGITPILSHVRELARRGASFELHYAVRSRQRMVFPEELSDLAGSLLSVYASTEGQRLDISRLLATYREDVQIYACGPDVLLRDVLVTGSSRGWRREQIHIEAFGPEWQPTDEGVRLELSLSGLTIDVPVGHTLLEAMESAGVWVPSDCRRGECHMCMTRVVEGDPIHRDHCLSSEERETSLTPCVSWGRGGRLVLEI
jgi:ferredoxin-NADP reductase